MAQEPSPGSYEKHRHVIDDPSLRQALLTQVRGTVDGLRAGYRWHVIASILAIMALFVLKPQGWLGEQRMLLIGLVLVVDILALAGLRSVAAAPARYLLPLVIADLAVIGVLVGLTLANGSWNLTSLLLLVFPAMQLVYLRDAKTIAPILAEHAQWRKAQAKAPDASGDA